MIQYFVTIHDDDCWGPFDSLREPMALLNQTSRDRGHTDEQAQHFFLHQSTVESVETGGSDACNQL
jgi:hypothetical protein